MLVAFGPETLALGGRCFDDVVLHTFFTDETTGPVRAHGEGRRRAGRPRPRRRCKVWSCFATVGDHLPEDLRLMKTVGPPRPPTSRATATCWCAPTAGTRPCSTRFRADPVVAGVAGGLDAVGTTEQLEHVATLIPDEWLAPAATGSPEQCVAAVRGQFDLGATA